jgi:pyridoxine 5-phosphate synthase
LRQATAADLDVGAATTLAELAGADGVRLGIEDARKPVTEEDVANARRAARGFELRMPANPGLIKIALEARPDRALLAASAVEGAANGGALDLRTKNPALSPVMRPLEEARIPAWLRIAPRLEAVKAAHGEGASGVELYTAGIVDLPPGEKARELDSLRDAVRLAAKLRMSIGLGGGLGYRTLPEILDAAPAASRIEVGRAVVSRALLVGLDRAVRDLRALLR